MERIINGTVKFHFFQVKTKGKLNHQWNLLEVFSIKQKGQGTDAESLKKIKNSFIGKLLQNGIAFEDGCCEMTLLSNVHFDDLVIKVIDELRAGKFLHKTSKLLADNFSVIFPKMPPLTADQAKISLGKLSLHSGVNYISDDREYFVNAARAAIHKYSEVDLNFYEITEIANNLLDLVFRRSKGSVSNLDSIDIKKRSSVALDDLLGVLSISPGAYRALQSGEGASALKTASILQRVLTLSGASSTMIEYASQQKVAWDIWLRDARHNHTAFDLEFLLHKIDAAYMSWKKIGASFVQLEQIIFALNTGELSNKFPTVNGELIFGALQASIVRNYSR